MRQISKCIIKNYYIKTPHLISFTVLNIDSMYSQILTWSYFFLNLFMTYFILNKTFSFKVIVLFENLFKVFDRADNTKNNNQCQKQETSLEYVTPTSSMLDIYVKKPKIFKYNKTDFVFFLTFYLVLYIIAVLVFFWLYRDNTKVHCIVLLNNKSFFLNIFISVIFHTYWIKRKFNYKAFPTKIAKVYNVYTTFYFIAGLFALTPFMVNERALLNSLMILWGIIQIVFIFINSYPWKGIKNILS